MRFLDSHYKPNKDCVKLAEENAPYYACVNTPHIDYLIEFSKELIKVGFKGILFDGNTLSNLHAWPEFQPGCCCKYCAEKFKKDTGFDIPVKVDYSDKIFKVWVKGNISNIVIFQDVCFKTCLVNTGGWGYGHILFI